MDNLEEMDKYLENFNLLRLKNEKIQIMKNPITSTEIEAVNKDRPQNKNPGPDSFTGEFCETFRGLNAYPAKILSKNCKGRNTSKLIL